MSCKSFGQEFPDSENCNVRKQGWFWGTLTEWESTQNTIKSIKTQVVKNRGDSGEEHWNYLILKEVSQLNIGSMSYLNFLVEYE